ncbi:MAG: hydrogenase maturation nickel metallochaperone HypA [Thermoguttaceae bacterium]
MHELSIVEALIEQVQREVQRSGHRGKILRIELSIGRISGVNRDSLRFAFDLLTPSSAIEGAEIVIREVKPTCRCHACGARMEIDDLVINCPLCASDDILIEGGRDLMLQSIDIEDEQSVESG